MSIIKSARVYKAELPSIDALNTHFAERPFVDPQVFEHTSIGFERRSADSDLVDPIEGGFAFTVRIDDKIVPAAAVKAEVQKRVKASEEMSGQKVGRKERAEIKEYVIDDFVRKSMIRTTIVTCLYDKKRGYLIVPTSNATIADRITSLLVSVVGSIKTETIHVSNVKLGLTTRINAWLDDDMEGFDEFQPTGQVALTLDGQSLTIKMDVLESAREGLLKALKQGFTVKSLRLMDNDLVSFVMTSDFIFKSIKFPEMEGSEDDTWADEAAIEMFQFSNVIERLSAMFAYKEGEAQ